MAWPVGQKDDRYREAEVEAEAEKNLKETEKEKRLGGEKRQEPKL